MFDEKEIIEFFNRIINAPNLKEEEIETNVTKFHQYLVLTKMCTEETLDKVAKIVQCIKELLKIKKTLGFIDIRTLLAEKPEQPMKLSKKPRKRTTRTHYSSGCGGGIESNNGC